MRQKLIAGNWKMYKTIPESETLLKGVLTEGARTPRGVGVAVCPPFTSLALAAQLLKGSGVHLGAQNMSEHDEGAYTGEISWKMLKAAGCTMVILGHSERRQYYGETDEKVNAKARKALANGLIPIICVGEGLDIRKEGRQVPYTLEQLDGSLEGITAEQAAQVVIAPV